MSTATLEYKLPEEEEEFQEALLGHKWKFICLDFDDWLRSQIKYQNIETLPLQDIRDKLLSLIKESNLET